MPRTDIEQSRTVFDSVRCRFGFYLCHRIPKPTGLGMVSLSHLRSSLPLIRLSLGVLHMPVLSDCLPRAAVRLVARPPGTTEGTRMRAVGVQGLQPREPLRQSDEAPYQRWQGQPTLAL
jgi:hypothetical protein